MEKENSKALMKNKEDIERYLGLEQPNTITIMGGMFCGKTMATESLVESCHKKGYVIIYLYNPKKGDYESCYAMFEPQDKSQLAALKKEGRTPSKKNVKIYHPFTFNIPDKLLPEINWFTLPIKSLNRELISCIAETRYTTDSVSSLLNAINVLPEDAPIHDLIHYLHNSMTKSKTQYGGGSLLDSNLFSLESPQRITRCNVDEIVSWFKPFLTDYFLTPSNFKLNLDVKKILSDQKSYHYLDTSYIQDSKSVVFATMAFFNEIMNNISRANHKVLYLSISCPYLCH